MKKSKNLIPRKDKHGGWKLRTHFTKGTGKKSSKVSVACGCCDNSLDIYYGKDFYFEINGVMATRAE